MPGRPSPQARSFRANRAEAGPPTVRPARSCYDGEAERLLRSPVRTGVTPMSRLDLRYALAALALSATTLLASPISPALAAGTADLSLTLSADSTTVHSGEQVVIRARLGHTAAGTSAGALEIMLDNSFTNVRVESMTVGYRCTWGPDKFFDAAVKTVKCTTNRIDEGDVITVLAKAPINGKRFVVAGVSPLGAVDPDD